MDSPIATININIGMGKDNPVLKIRANDDISALVDQLIQNYQLPKKVHAIIMSRVHQQIPQTPKTQAKNGENSKPSSSTLKKKSISPLKSSNLSSSRPVTKRVVVMNKQNNPNLSNWQSETHKNLVKRDKSVSPLKKTSNQTILKKIEIKTNKSPAKSSAFTKKIDQKKQITTDPSLKISKLFRRLTKNNPVSVKIMSPEFINLKGLDKNLLGYLQEFFENLEEHEFDKMNESYFTHKTEELGFREILTKKQFDYCYID